MSRPRNTEKIEKFLYQKDRTKMQCVILILILNQQKNISKVIVGPVKKTWDRQWYYTNIKLPDFYYCIVVV